MEQRVKVILDSIATSDDRKRELIRGDAVDKAEQLSKSSTMRLWYNNNISIVRQSINVCARRLKSKGQMHEVYFSGGHFLDMQQ